MQNSSNTCLNSASNLHSGNKKKMLRLNFFFCILCQQKMLVMHHECRLGLVTPASHSDQWRLTCKREMYLLTDRIFEQTAAYSINLPTGFIYVQTSLWAERNWIVKLHVAGVYVVPLSQSALFFLTRQRQRGNWTSCWSAQGPKTTVGVAASSWE